jgi:hypothetical protein
MRVNKIMMNLIKLFGRRLCYANVQLSETLAAVGRNNFRILFPCKLKSVISFSNGRWAANNNTGIYRHVRQVCKEPAFKFL